VALLPEKASPGASEVPVSRHGHTLPEAAHSTPVPHAGGVPLDRPAAAFSRVELHARNRTCRAGRPWAASPQFDSGCQSGSRIPRIGASGWTAAEYPGVSEAGLPNPTAQRGPASSPRAGRVDGRRWSCGLFWSIGSRARWPGTIACSCSASADDTRPGPYDVVAADERLGLTRQRSDVRFQRGAFVLPEWRRRRFQMMGAAPAQGPDRLVGASPLVRRMVERTQTRSRSSRSPVPRHVLWAVGDTRPRFGKPVDVGRKRVSGDGVLAKTLVLLRAGASREPGSVRRRETSPAAGREP